MHPRLRTVFGFVLALIGLAFGPSVRLRAQDFTLATNTVNIATFSGQYYSVIDIALQSDDPTFNPASLNITNSAGGWIYSYVLAGSRAVRVCCYYGTGQDAAGAVTIRSATRTATLTVNRRCFTSYRTPKTLLSSDKTRIYALYEDAVLMFDARTQSLLASARISPPPGTAFPSDGRRVLCFSEDKSQLRVFISGCPLLFRLSPADLSSVGPLALPPANASSAHRVFAGEKAGKLYFVRYGAILNASDGNYSYYYQRHYQSVIDVVSAASGALLQSHSLPVSDQITTIGDLALHPERSEVWVRELRRASYYSSSTWLRRLSLDAAGLVGNTLGTPLFLQDSYSYYSVDPWTESGTRTLMLAGARQVISPPSVFEAAAEPPTALPGITSQSTFLSRGNVAASAGNILRLDTKESISSSVLEGADESYSPSIIGLSEDGLDVLVLSSETGSLPASRFLPAILAAQTTNQARVPADGQMTPPPAEFTWYALPGADHYRVYLSTTASDLAGAKPGDAFLLGEPEQASLTLSQALAAGATYFWRVDAVYGDRLVTGSVQSFSVSEARVEKQPREIATVAGARRRDFALPIVTSAADTAWEIVSDVPWITVMAGTGAGPGTAKLSIDAKTLAAGDRTAVVRIVTAAGSVPVTLKLRVQPSSVFDAVTRPGSARILAIGTSVSIGGANERLLFTIDTESEQILRCASVPSTTLSVSTSPRPTCSSSTSPFYVFEWGGRFGEFDPETLELKRVVSLPALNGWSFSAGTVRPVGDGRLWILGGNHTLARLNAAGDAYDLVLPSLSAGQSYLSADGESVYTFVRNGDYYYSSTSFTLRRYDLAGSSLNLAVEKTIAYPTVGYYYDSPVQGINPARLTHRGVAYDEDLNPITSIEDANLTVTDDGSCAFSGALIHLGDDYAEAYIIPSNFNSYGLRRYEEISRKLVYFDSPAIRFTAVDTFATVVPCTLKTTQVSDTQASFAWDKAPATGGWQSYYLTPQVAYRPAGSDQPWIIPYSYYYSNLALYGLSPKTNYEARARISNSSGVLSAWSDTLAFTTAVARPVYTYGSWPESVSIKEGEGLSLSLSASGESLLWQVSGLPSGLDFDSETNTFSGSATTPGRYSVQVTVSNAGGSFTQSFYVYVSAASSANPRARYSGLQSFSEDPLVGDWRAARSGDVVTGYIRTFVGGGPFKVKLPPAAAGDFYRIKDFRIRIDGVNVFGGFQWDTLTDRCSLSLSIYEYGSSTLDETGLGVSHDKAAPHPFAGRFTALSMKDPENPSGYLVPDGAGFMRIDLAVDGGVTVTAETSLGQPFTTSTSISGDGIIPIFSPHDGYHIWGLLQIDRSVVPSRPRLAGYLGWTKYTDRKSAFYRAGFVQQLLVFGAPLPVTGKTLPPLAPLANDTQIAYFSLSGGGLSRLSKPIVQSLTPSATGLVAPKVGTAENPNRVAVKLDAKTGLVTGSAAILDATGKKVVRPQSFRAQFVKDPLGDGRDVIGGYFHLPDSASTRQSGFVEIVEPEPAAP